MGARYKDQLVQGWLGLKYWLLDSIINEVLILFTAFTNRYIQLQIDHLSVYHVFFSFLLVLNMSWFNEAMTMN